MKSGLSQSLEAAFDERMATVEKNAASAQKAIDANTAAAINALKKRQRVLKEECAKVEKEMLVTLSTQSDAISKHLESVGKVDFVLPKLVGAFFQFFKRSKLRGLDAFSQTSEWTKAKDAKP